MGIADLGLINRSGTLEPTVLSTSSVEGTASIETAQSVYLDGDTPDMFGVQMNAVATGVELRGQPGFQFWAQDFFSYTSSTGSLSFGDNLWNFSNAAALFPANSLYSHGPNGTLVAPIFYYATGPTFTVHYPFSVTFAINAAVIAKRPAIFFNYTVASPTLNTSGSFDEVVFNSARIPIPVLAAPPPLFQANGTGYDPVGLPNDLELVLVGNGNGDTTSFVRLHAAFSLSTWNSTAAKFEPVASAYDAGSDTGESSNGVAVSYNTTGAGATIPQAVLQVGPSFLHGLWNYSNNPGYRTVSASVLPVNSFLFVSPGNSLGPNVAQWVPTLAFTTGPEIIPFPNGGNYYFEWILSDYRPVHRSLNPAANATATVTATLIRSNALGVYTPLIAWGNAQLPAIAASGTGTVASPYVLDANQNHPISELFGAMNFFFFPVFPGILLIGTDASVRVTPSSLAITYSAAVAANLSTVGLPSSNHLQIEFWNVENATLTGAPGISGWLSSNVGFSPLAAVLFWGADGNLIADNTFYDQGNSLAFYGGSKNTVWGNTFLDSTAPATNQSAVENSGNNTTGIWESESNDLVYNNYFAVPAPAYTPTIDAASCQIVCQTVEYRDVWNVTRAPADTVRQVLGTNLSGSVIGTSYQGGNYWSNYGTASNPLGRLPYNDSGRITFDGDYVPLVPSKAYPVTVAELGLAPGVVWGVDVAGIDYRTNQTLLTIYAANGTYNYSVLEPVGYTAPSTGNFTINGTGTGVSIDFTALVALLFTETGIVAGWSWNVTIVSENTTENGTVNSTNASIVFEVEPGLYNWSASSYGYNATPVNGTVGVGPAGTEVPQIVFSLYSIVVFTETGLRAGTPWTVVVTGGTNPEQFTSFAAQLNLTIFDLPSGAYAWSDAVGGYTANPPSGTGTGGTPAAISLQYTIIDGTFEGTVSVASAELWVGGNETALTDGAFAESLVPGVYSVVVIAPGYIQYDNNVTITSGATTSLQVQLTAIPTAPASGPAGISYAGWGVIGLLAVIAAIGLILAARRQRPGAPPAPPTPYAVKPPSTPPTPVPSTRPPWQEDETDTSIDTPGSARR